MNRNLTRVLLLPFLLGVCPFSAAAHARGGPPAAQAPAPSERDSAAIVRDNAVTALAAARAKIEEGDVQTVLTRLPGVADVETIRQAYRLEPRVRRALLDIERLERLRDHPETRGNEPAGLAIPSLITAHEQVLKEVISRTTPPLKAESVRSEVKLDVEKFVEQLRLHPTKPSDAADRLGIYVLQVETGEVLLVADEPDPGFTYCGSPEWSVDGNRILFDAIPAPGNLFSQSKLKSLERIDGQLRPADLGPGNCPTGTPEGSAIVFLLNPNAVAGAQAGVWSMKADGTDRNFLCEYGRPSMSPDGKHLMVASFGNPKRVSMLDVDTGEFREVLFPGYRTTSNPVWVNPGSFVSMIQSEMGEAIALVDAKSPAGLKVESILWKPDPNVDLFASHPAYSAVTGRCAFVGLSREGRALYSVRLGTNEPPKRLETGRFDNMIASLAFSPDGKYLLFCGDRAGVDKK